LIEDPVTINSRRQAHMASTELSTLRELALKLVPLQAV